VLDRLSNSGNVYVDFELLQTPMSKTATGFATQLPKSGGRTLVIFYQLHILKMVLLNLTSSTMVNLLRSMGIQTYFSSLPVNSKTFAAGNTSTHSCTLSGIWC
jgi:hypothetical protein